VLVSTAEPARILASRFAALLAKWIGPTPIYTRDRLWCALESVIDRKSESHHS
jgi:hypothetical protein